MVCHGEHTYLYSQLLMYMLSQDAKGGSNVRRLCQEVDASAHSKWVAPLSQVVLSQVVLTAEPGGAWLIGTTWYRWVVGWIVDQRRLNGVTWL